VTQKAVDPAFGTHLREAAQVVKEFWNRPALQQFSNVGRGVPLTSGLVYTLADSHVNAVSYNAADVLKSSGGLHQ
jgi:hypothetical protein